MSKTKPVTRRIGRPPGTGIYPWAKWFARRGGITLHWGKDFSCTPVSMMAGARKQAARLGYTLSCGIGITTLTIKATRRA